MVNLPVVALAAGGDGLAGSAELVAVLWSPRPDPSSGEANDVVNGFGAGTCLPNDDITRGQASARP